MSHITNEVPKCPYEVEEFVSGVKTFFSPEELQYVEKLDFAAMHSFMGFPESPNLTQRILINLEGDANDIIEIALNQIFQVYKELADKDSNYKIGLSHLLLGPNEFQLNNLTWDFAALGIHEALRYGFSRNLHFAGMRNFISTSLLLPYEDQKGLITEGWCRGRFAAAAIVDQLRSINLINSVDISRVPSIPEIRTKFSEFLEINSPIDNS